MLLDKNSFNSIIKTTRLSDRAVDIIEAIFINHEPTKEVAIRFNVSIQHVNTLKSRFQKKIEQASDLTSFMAKNKPRLATQQLLEHQREIFKLRESGYTLQQILDFLDKINVVVAMSTLSHFLREKS